MTPRTPTTTSAGAAGTSGMDGIAGGAEVAAATSAPGLALDRHVSAADRAVALARDVLTGLTANPRELPPKWFYDATGGMLFDEITKLPEYYPTRRERAILDSHASDIATACPADTLIELGSGTSEKTRLLLDALRAAGGLRRFVPFDVDESTLTQAGRSLIAAYPDLAVHAVVGDFERHLSHLPGGGRRLIAFLGGTIGNMQPAQRGGFLRALREQCGSTDALLLGTDLVKDPDRLVAAYDDGAGVTAAFNRNVLTVINRELGADFDIRGFAHVARWNAADSWIEMRLRAVRDQRVTIDSLALTVEFQRGEDLLTEISAKFTRDGITAELADAGWAVTQQWTDPEGDFAVTLATPSTAPAAAPV
ncbi:L-histidine N(alpha)-methyltransferase [Frankia sp. QA3]|uniref:L-histidine N(alpha)-methyltransferase n=1 Tax=Frankia sp. QA3 TaxID=710111 RepID=UPI000269C9DC|nr:L-histidine N(alpha)-methyltransferase [Frankia sp. QA3]EIV95109.1 putative methyltransferase [Frankia sp. QA3]